MLNKKIAAIAVSGALMISMLSAATVFATEADAPAATEERIESLESRYDDLYTENEALWEKVDDALFALEDEDAYGEDFDEAEFISNLDSLTDAEKETLIGALNEMEAINEELDELYETQMMEDMTEEEKAAYLQLKDLYEQEAAIYEEHEDLWNAVYDAEAAAYEDGSYLDDVEGLTEDQKAQLLAADAELEAIYEQIAELDEQVDATMTEEQIALNDQVSAIYDQQTDLYLEYSELWEKVIDAEAEEDVWADEEFDEKEFIKNTDCLTEDEKATLLSVIEQTEELEEQAEALREQAEAAATDEQKAIREQIYALYDRADEIFESCEELWNIVYEDDDETIDYSYEEALIQKMDSLTDEEKAVLLSDIEQLKALDAQIFALEEIAYGC